jgi:hypothetical protein
VVANAFHHRSDAISSVLALLSIAWAMAGFAAADAAAGLLVAGMIAMTGCDILAESIQQLSDSANLDLQDDLREVVEEWVDTDPDVLQITTLRARQVGSASFCDVTVETWPDLTTTATRAVEERLKRYLVPKLQERTGQWITATVNAKAPLEVKDMVLSKDDDDVDGSRINNAASDASGSRSSAPGNQDSFKAMNAVIEDLTASQVEMRVRQCALQLDSVAYRLQSVQVHYLSPESVSVDITLDQSKMGLDDLKESARSLQSALENDLEEIHSARIYLDLIGRGREHGVSDEVSAVTSPPSIPPTSVVSTKRLLVPATVNTDIHGQGDLSLLEVDPEWLSSFAYDMQQIWNESNTQSTNSTFNRQ